MKNKVTLTCKIAYFLRRYTKIYLFLSLLISLSASPDAFARLRDYETTRLKSTAGTGVGSILMDEASILNPASLAFYTVGSIYFQKGDSTITPQEGNSGYAGNEAKTMGIIASDASKGTGGSVSYTKHTEGFEEQSRLSMALASPVTKKSAIGAIARRSTDILSPSGQGNDLYEEKYTQFIFGITHALSDSFTFGLVAVDPLKEKEKDTRALLGFQYTFEKIISIMGDMGTDYNNDLSNTLLWKAAIQVRAYDDFYVRFGAFDDRNFSERGNGAGIGWVGPKLVAEISFKNTKVNPRADINQEEQSIKETSFSLAYKF